LKDAQIDINIEIELDPYMTPDEIIATGRLKLLRNRARSKAKNLDFIWPRRTSKTLNSNFEDRTMIRKS